jgi:polyhydroxyalkanoate synthase
VIAACDHIVPAAGSEPQRELIAFADATELRLKAGHVGLLAGRQASKVTLPQIAAWLQEHSEETS